jgi:F420-non-reducing hydrogenase iron-sulfur subunit
MLSARRRAKQITGASKGRPFFPRAMTTREKTSNVAIFFCQQLDPDQDVNRRALEKELGSRIRFFPLPCSGRIEALHLMRALEAGADKVYLVTCPVGACRYREGNIRARTRVEFARKLIEEIGLEPERFELVNASLTGPCSIDVIARELISKAEILAPSPLSVKEPKKAAHNTP